MTDEKQEVTAQAQAEEPAGESPKETPEKTRSLGVFSFEGDMPLAQAIPLGLQHVLAMFVGNLTPLLIVTSACGLAGAEFADVQLSLLQNAMWIAGVVTLIQLFGIGPVGGKVPIIMGTSSGFIGVFNSVAASMGGGLIAYGAIMGASLIGGLFEAVLGFFLKPLRRFFPAVVTGTVVLSIGLSLISVGVNAFGGGNTAPDFGSFENLCLALIVLIVILAVKHATTGFVSASSILAGIIVGYVVAGIMGLVLPTTGVTADGVEYTKAWVLNWDKVAAASWFAIPNLLPVMPVFDMRAIAPVLVMFIVTAVETVGDISGVTQGGMNREATDKELSGGVMCDGLGLVAGSHVRRAAQHLVQPERRPGHHDQNGQPQGPGLRRRIPGSMRLVPEARRRGLYHAPVGPRRRGRYDVRLHRGERHSADHARTPYAAQLEHRFRRTWPGLRHWREPRRAGWFARVRRPDFRRLWHCRRSCGRHHFEYRASQRRKRENAREGRERLTS